MVFHPLGRVLETCRISAKVHWNCSDGTWWPFFLPKDSSSTRQNGPHIITEPLHPLTTGGPAFRSFPLMCHLFVWCRLVLEWNALGVWDEAFSLFCEGLASNSVLTQLDLRNNQINHHGAAELALALKRNNTLEVLGESCWNIIWAFYFVCVVWCCWCKHIYFYTSAQIHRSCLKPDDVHYHRSITSGFCRKQEPSRGTSHLQQPVTKRESVS